jgi:Adenylate and Guanylate cyclase catalytic domain
LILVGRRAVTSCVFTIGSNIHVHADILPEGSNGIHVVFRMCDVNFTYQINGMEAQYLGVGDRHDAKYDRLGVNSSFHNLGSFAIRDSLYSGAPLDQAYCNYTLYVYPSDVMKDKFTSKNPALFTIVTILIFAFTSLVFYLYDATVEYRQKSVLKTAVRSTKIVSSLFPSAVRDRLYPAEEPSPTGKKNKLKAFLPETAKAKLQNFIADGKTSETSALSDTAESDSPIAELYPETTVLFADIAGFTSWSSSRQPTHVFRLLETLYASFDEIAKQRGVFKVETIGDCYLAVVGLPTPRKGHAVVMTRFAADCRNKMQELTMELEKTLGPVSFLVLPSETHSSIQLTNLGTIIHRALLNWLCASG